MTTSVLDRTDLVLEAGLAHPASSVIGEALPCRANNPELWFAESPHDVEMAKASASHAQSARCASTGHSIAASRGACGAASSSSRGL